MSAADRRVVVTGMGVVSALGIGVEATWDGLVAGRSGIRWIDSFDPCRVTSKIAATVVGFDASGVLDRKEIRRTDRYTQFGLVAAREALDPGRAARPPRRQPGRAQPGSSWGPGWAA